MPRPAKPKAKAPARRRAAARKLLKVRAPERGLASAEVALAIETPELAELAAEVRSTGGAPIGAYREPFSGRPLLLATLPVAVVAPTPFQRDLSPTHTQRLAAKIEEVGSFLDPIIVVRGAASAGGGFWTPNGRHRLAAAKVLGLKQLTALISPDEGLAFRILALNTEKAHNLKDKSLEVIRMARALAEREPKAREKDFAAPLEAAELLTLGAVYERESRFAGGAYSPLLKKVDRFSEKPLPASLAERGDWAARLLEIDAGVRRVIEELRRRGFQSPYLRNFVVARVNPVRFHRAKKGDTRPPMPLPAALTRMAAAVKRFDCGAVKTADLALVAGAVGEPAEE